MHSPYECPYYAPCGLCTNHNKPCNEVCNKKPFKSTLTPLDHQHEWEIVNYNAEGEECRCKICGMKKNPII